MGRWLPLPLERRLALLMSGVLVAILATSLVLTYGTLTRVSERASRERIAPAALQIAASAHASTAQRAQTMQRWSVEPALRRALRSANALDDATLAAGATKPYGTVATTALAALAPHFAASDTLLPIHLYDRRGRLVLAAGAASGLQSERALGSELEWLGATDRAPGSDSATFSAIHEAGGIPYFWAIAPVNAAGVALGHIAQRHRVGGPPNIQTQLQDLIGEPVTMYVRNQDGTAWTTASTMAAAPDRREVKRGLLHHRARGQMIAEEAAIAGTPWLVVLETPLSDVHAGARRTVVHLSLLSVFLVAGGALLSWAIGRRITQPLVSLTSAAEAIAGGDYDRRLGTASRRDDEIGRMLTMFDQMAEEVAATRHALEHQVAEAEHAREQAERANRAKGDFLAVMSHELRTPLNAIGGYAQLLTLGVYGPVSVEQREALERLGRSQAHLLRLIDEVLNLARIDAGEATYKMARVPLAEVLEGLEPLVAPQMLARGIRFELGAVPNSIAAHADAEKLQQVLLNLLENASKYTRAGGTVRVDCDSDDRYVRIHVTDSGIGIPLERQASIFERFVQGERSLSRPDEGVGLGLTISRELARGMGGELSVQSEPGSGSVFTVRLDRFEQPAGVNGERAATSELVSSPQMRRPRNHY